MGAGASTRALTPSRCSQSLLRCLLGSIFAAIAALALYWRDGVVPDPLVAGAAAPFALLSIAVLAMLAYAVIVLLSLPTRRNP